jgi:hypothetical protein
MRQSTFVIRLGAVLIIALVALSLLTVSAFADGHEEYPTIAAAEDGTITLPDEWVSGITTLNFVNEGEAPFSPLIGRFLEGMSMEDFMAAMGAQDIAAMLATASFLGSPSLESGESTLVTFDLAAGDYLFLNFASAGPPTILPFTVAESEGDAVEAPEADVVVELADFAFVLPAELTTEDALWQISNTGDQTHEIVVYAVDEGTTTDDVTTALTEAMAAAAPGTQPEMPYEFAYSFVGISPGETAWVMPELEAGSYVAVCFIPDVTSEEMTSHLEHGMISVFTVSE